VPFPSTKIRQLTKYNLILCPTQLLPHGRGEVRVEPLEVDTIAQCSTFVCRAPRDANHLPSYRVAVSQVEMGEIEGCCVSPTSRPTTRAVLTRQRAPAADDQRDSRHARGHSSQDARAGQKGMHDIAAKVLHMYLGAHYCLNHRRTPEKPPGVSTLWNSKHKTVLS
jgi:hypothetical protein